MSNYTTITPNRNKILVDVLAQHYKDGKTIPISFCFDEADEHVDVNIDAVLEVKEAPAMKAGGQGTRYKIRARFNDREVERYLFQSHIEGVWFIERGNCN